MESFTDGTLVDLALGSDREAIAEVSGLIAARIKGSEVIVNGFCSIGKGISPNDAFYWKDRGKRLGLSHAARAAKEGLIMADLLNDVDLYDYAISVFKGLAAGRTPDDVFRWGQKEGGRIKHCNELRNWDICMTYHNLRSEGYTREIAIQVLYELTNLRKTSIEQITKALTGKNEPDLPDDIFPLPVDELIKQPDIEKALSKVLKSKAKSS